MVTIQIFTKLKIVNISPKKMSDQYYYEKIPTFWSRNHHSKYSNLPAQIKRLDEKIFSVHMKIVLKINRLS